MMSKKTSLLVFFRENRVGGVGVDRFSLDPVPVSTMKIRSDKYASFPASVTSDLYK